MDATTVRRPPVALLDWLREHAIDHEVHEHAEAVTASETAHAEGVAARTFAKVVGVETDDGRRALCVLDAPDRLDLDKARTVLGARHVRLLAEAELGEIAPECEIGALPAIGALFGLPTIADHAVGDDSEISFNAGTHRHSVRVDRAAWARAAGVLEADLALEVSDRPAWADA